MTNTIAMSVDPRKVSLAEKDIEDWLYENPSAITLRFGSISQWIARQYSIPSGIADLVGIIEGCESLPESVAVVEIKNVEINKAAILQVCRYAYDVKEIISRRMDCPRFPSGEPHVICVVIGPSIDNVTFAEATACHVSVITFGVSMQLELNRLGLSREYLEKRNAEYDKIAYQTEWNRYGEHLDDRVQRMTEESQLADELDEELNENIG